MFFKKKEENTKEASEYKRGYNDGYNHGISKTNSNVTKFNNDINYIRGYEYGYRVGLQQANMNEINLKKKQDKPINHSLNNLNSNQKITGQENINHNMFNNFSKNKF